MPEGKSIQVSLHYYTSVGGRLPEVGSEGFSAGILQEEIKTSIGMVWMRLQERRFDERSGK
jgi:hypothetical protein